MSIKPWMSAKFLQTGVQLGIRASRETGTTDVSLTSWGTVCQGRPAHGAWTATQRGWHINRLELLAVFIALQYFLNLLIGRHVLLRSDNIAVVSYLNQQGGLRSHPLCRVARIILLGLRTDSVDPSGSCPRALELRNGFVLRTEPGARGMEVAPPNGQCGATHPWFADLVNL